MSAPVPASQSLLHRAAALADGMSDGELARAVRRGELVRLQRGSYIDGELPADAELRHAMVVAATIPGLRLAGVVSHTSAA